MPSAPQPVVDLVERFDRNRSAYRSGQYNEAQLRYEFLDPFFAALGWDMTNSQGYSEAYKDVVHEDAIEMNGARKLFLPTGSHPEAWYNACTQHKGRRPIPASSQQSALERKA